MAEKKTDPRVAAKRDAAQWIDAVWAAGYGAGVDAVQEKLRPRGESTWLDDASPEDRARYPHYDLSYFCHVCGKGIPEYGGLYDFCPFCGRKIVKRKG